MKKGDIIFILIIIAAVYFLSRTISKSANTNAEHLRRLSPSVRQNFIEFLDDIKKMGYTPVIRDSSRTYEQQQYYYNKDKRNAPPGHGTHELRTAIDLDVYKNGKVYSKRTPKSEWEKTGIPALAKNKFLLRWGGNFKNYADNNHFDYLTT